jgi:hypothetical protein
MKMTEAAGIVRRHRFARTLLFSAGLLLCHAVAGQSRDLASTGQAPPPNDRFYIERQDGIQVRSAVPSSIETIRIFGVGLYARNIQPVWLEITNNRDENIWFLQSGVDEAYFTPIETSYRRQNRIALLDWTINRDFYEKTIDMLIGPGETKSGYVFTRVDQGTKSFNVDVLSREEQFRMSFFVPVPGLKLDHYDVDWAGMYDESEIRDVGLEELAAYLESLPCCVTDKKGTNKGDPLNLVLIGDVADAYYAFMRAGWDETETIYSGSLWKTLGSAMSGGEYRYSPVSALYVFGRPQDVAMQKSRTSIHKRNHLRLWLTPVRFEGKPVLIGQISRDIGVRFTWKTITTHKIDPDVDETREYLLEDLAYAQSLRGFGYVRGVGEAPFDAPRGNLTGDPYFTDGLRLVLVLSKDAVDISEIDFVDLGMHPILVDPE